MIPPKTALSASYYRILNRLWKRGPAPVPALTKELDLSKTIAARMVEQMVREGIVGIEEDCLNLSRTYGTVLGLSPGTQSIQAVLTDFTGALLADRELPFPTRQTSLVHTLASATAQMEAEFRGTVPPLRGVALSLPGIVDPDKLILFRSHPLEISQPLDLRNTLGRLLGRPLSAENDANCCCWAEALLQRTDPPGNFLCLLAQLRPFSSLEEHRDRRTLAVGMGLFLNGKVHYGRQFSSGEYKSIIKTDDSQRSQFSVQDEAMDRFLTDPGVELQVAREWALHAAFLVNALNLEKVGILWPLDRQIETVTGLVRREIQRNWSYETSVECRVESLRLGGLSPAYGAAAFHLESLYRPPGL